MGGLLRAMTTLTGKGLRWWELESKVLVVLALSSEDVCMFAHTYRKNGERQRCGMKTASDFLHLLRSHPFLLDVDISNVSK